nr:unnamed protein product [Digitaria exilis]
MQQVRGPKGARTIAGGERPAAAATGTQKETKKQTQDLRSVSLAMAHGKPASEINEGAPGRYNGIRARTKRRIGLTEEGEAVTAMADNGLQRPVVHEPEEETRNKERNQEQRRESKKPGTRREGWVLTGRRIDNGSAPLRSSPHLEQGRFSSNRGWGWEETAERKVGSGLLARVQPTGRQATGSTDHIAKASGIVANGS